jgi:hypothetical protein
VKTERRLELKRLAADAEDASRRLTMRVGDLWIAAAIDGVKALRDVQAERDEARARVTRLKKALRGVLMRWTHEDLSNVPPYAEGEWCTDEVRAEDVHALIKELAKAKGGG